MAIEILAIEEYRGNGICCGSLSMSEQRAALEALRREGRYVAPGETYVRSRLDNGRMAIIRILAEARSSEVIEAFECCL